MSCHLYLDLPAPTNVKATALSHFRIEVTWDQLPDASEYTISYTTTAASHISVSVTVNGGTTTNHILNNLEQNTTYTITVQAMTSDNRKSAISNKVLVTTGKSLI